MKTLKIEVRPYESATQAINRTMKEIKDSVHIEITALEGKKDKSYTLSVVFQVMAETHEQIFVFDEIRLEMTDEAKWKEIQKSLKAIEDKERGPY